MICKVNINPNEILTYHETGEGDTIIKIANIKNTTEYTKLCEEVYIEGIIDPIIVRCEPERLYVEIGEQRVLAARDLGIDILVGIAYNIAGAEITLAGKETLTSITDIEAVFPRKTMETIRSNICPLCQTDLGGSVTEEKAVPALTAILGYVNSGIATFD